MGNYTSNLFMTQLTHLPPLPITHTKPNMTTPPPCHHHETTPQPSHNPHHKTHNPRDPQPITPMPHYPRHRQTTHNLHTTHTTYNLHHTTHATATTTWPMPSMYPSSQVLHKIEHKHIAITTPNPNQKSHKNNQTHDLTINKEIK